MEILINLENVINGNGKIKIPFRNYENSYLLHLTHIFSEGPSAILGFILIRFINIFLADRRDSLWSYS